MTDVLAVLGVSVVVFASTNVDDLLLLAVFFADPRMRARSVVAGQFLGIGILVAASAAAAFAASTIPAGWVALLGVVPLALGLRGLWRLRRLRGSDGSDGDPRPALRPGSQVAAVAAVTVANGGDNLGVYVPLFARAPDDVALHAAVFAVMTAVWCWAGHRVVRRPRTGERLRRHGHVVLPVVLVALGAWILTGTRSLLR